MKKNFRNLFLVLTLSFLFVGFVFNHITAQQQKWVTYHGDFANFDIRYDYEMNYKHSGRNFTYTIFHPDRKDKKLIISSGHQKMDFKLPKKQGYVTQSQGTVKVKNTQGIERKGTTPNDTHWREVYLYYAIQGTMGPDTTLIHCAYDDVDGEESQTFNKIIDSIEVRDPYQIKVNPQFP